MQPPKPIEEMTLEEQRRWEELVEEHAELHSQTPWDTLESLRKLLNKSELEMMHIVKKQSRFGIHCSYYLKAKMMWEKNNQAQFLSLLEQFLSELPDDIKNQIGVSVDKG